VLDALAEIAECPLTAEPLRVAAHAELEALNVQVAERSLHHADGSPVERPFQQALRSASGGTAYRVDEGVAALLPELAIVAGDASGSTSRLQAEKKVVRDFYETFGWQKQDGEYLDTLEFVDRRPASMEYLQRCHRRVRDALPAAGRFLLDAASGPVQYDESRRFSEGFEYRVCVDFSALALREAQRNLGEHGIYVLGDVTRLPFRAYTFDAAVSLHTIYHVPAEEQRRAFEEIARVLRPDATGVIVYQWSHQGRVLGAARKAANLVRRALGRRTDGGAARMNSAVPPPLYAHPRTYGWFRKQDWPFDADVRVWRSVSGKFLRRYVPDGRSGRTTLRLLQALEDRAPHIAGRVGRFPMIVIRKGG
jgi:SAM-dependent methyltransferase/uncharacterized protein YbaR (Trm112 family)